MDIGMADRVIRLSTWSFTDGTQVSSCENLLMPYLAYLDVVADQTASVRSDKPAYM